MIGNDIVDLGDARTLRNHDRFDARVFTPHELGALEAAPDRRVMRWTKWAAKEAAYKSLRDPSIRFIPREFDVDHMGTVRWKGREISTSVAGAARGYIHVTAGDAWHAVKERMHDDRTDDVRALVAEAVGDGFEDLCYFGPVPTMLLNGEAMPVSISHHGRFVAAAFPWSTFRMVG